MVANPSSNNQSLNYVVNNTVKYGKKKNTEKNICSRHLRYTI